MGYLANSLIDNLGNRSRRGSSGARGRRSEQLVDFVVCGIVLLATAFCVSAYVRSARSLSEMKEKHEAAIARVELLKIEAERLEREVSLLRNDPIMIETHARQRLGMVRPGEVVIRVDSGGADVSSGNTLIATRRSTAGRVVLSNSRNGRAAEAGRATVTGLTAPSVRVTGRQPTPNLTPR